MKYVPKPDVEGINVSEETHPLKDIAILLAGFLVVLGVLMVVLAMAGEFLLSKVSLEREIQVFSKFDWTQDEPKNLNILLLEEMVEKLSPDKDLKFKISVMCESLPNAFAFPGGQIGVTSGLLRKVKTEGGLAFVVAHEIGHIVNRHHLKGLGYQLGIAFASAIVGAGVSDSISGALLGDVIGRRYSRTSEADADRFALGAMTRAYGSTAGATEFFEVALEEENALMQSMPSWMSTHPATNERLSVIKGAQEPTSDDLIAHGLTAPECD